MEFKVLRLQLCKIEGYRINRNIMEFKVSNYETGKSYPDKN